MRVSWTPPDFSGGSFLLAIGYIVEYKDSDSEEWTKINTNKITDTSIVVKDLLEKTWYQFRVSAENQIGLGKCSKPCDLCTTLGRY